MEKQITSVKQRKGRTTPILIGIMAIVTKSKSSFLLDLLVENILISTCYSSMYAPGMLGLLAR
jgi:hypothetical protein